MTTQTKTLYLLVASGGDGSYRIHMTFDENLIAKMQACDEAGKLDYECDPGVDGDGFHYATIEVSAYATYESLGIDRPFLDDGRYDLAESDE